MMRTLTDWRRSVGACSIALAAVGLPVVSHAADEAPADQTQKVDAATKKLMAATGLYTRGLFKLAADQYTEFLDQYPDHKEATAARYALAVCRYRLADYDKAVESLRKVLQDQKFPQRDEALLVMGHCELSSNHYDKAQAAFDELLQNFPSSKRAEAAMLYRGQSLFLAGKHKEAADACKTYLDKYPQGASRPDAMYFLALSQRSLNQNDAAVKTLEQLATDFPQSRYQLDATLLAGQALEAQGKLDAAVEQYRRMLAMAPEARKADALYSLGLALYKSGKYDEAAKELASVVNDFASSQYAKPAKLQLGMVELAGKHVDNARQILGLVAREDPERAVDAQYGLAECDIAQQRFEPARELLGELLKLQPPPANVAQIALDRAVCAMELKQFQQASTELESFPQQYPNAPQLTEAVYRRAFCLHKLNKFDQSHDLCQQVAKLKESDFSDPTRELDAENLFLLGKYADAEKQFDALASSAKDDTRRLRFTYRTGQCEYFAAHYPAAVKILQPVAENPAVQRTAELQQAIFLLGDALRLQDKNAEAVGPLKQFVQIAQGDKREAMFKLALAQKNSKDAAGAEQTLAALTQGATDSEWVQRGLFEYGQLQLDHKKFDDAAGLFRRVVSSNAPPDIAAPAAYQLGWAEMGAKRYAEAAARWKEMAEKYPNDKLAADAQFQQGVALKQAKQFEPALGALNAYAAAHPDGQHFVQAKQLAASCLTELKRDDEAARMLTSIADQAKGAADGVLYDLAWAQRGSKDLPAAMTTYRRLLKDHPDSKLAPAARTELAEMLEDEKKYADAAELLEQVVNLKNVDEQILARAQYRLGFCYEKLNKPDKAAAVFASYTQKAGGNDAMNASALLQAGIANAENGKFDQAEKYLSDMLHKYPQHKDAPVAMLRLAQAQAEQNKYDASARSYQDFLQKYSTSDQAFRAQFGIGWALENQKQYDAARKAYEKAIAMTNGETAARAQFQIGETYLAEGKFEKAIPALLAVEDVYKYPTWSARALFEAGRAFEQLKQPDQAKRQYTQIVSKYKDEKEANLAQERLKDFKGG